MHLCWFFYPSSILNAVNAPSTTALYYSCNWLRLNGFSGGLGFWGWGLSDSLGVSVTHDLPSGIAQRSCLGYFPYASIMLLHQQVPYKFPWYAAMQMILSYTFLLNQLTQMAYRVWWWQWMRICFISSQYFIHGSDYVACNMAVNNLILYQYLETPVLTEADDIQLHDTGDPGSSC